MSIQSQNKTTTSSIMDNNANFEQDRTESMRLNSGEIIKSFQTKFQGLQCQAQLLNKQEICKQQHQYVVTNKKIENCNVQMSKIAQENKRLLIMIAEKDKQIQQKSKKIQQLSSLQDRQQYRITKLMKQLQRVSLLLQRLIKKQIKRDQYKSFQSPQPKNMSFNLDLSKLYLNDEDDFGYEKHNLSYDFNNSNRTIRTEHRPKDSLNKDLSMSYFSNYIPEAKETISRNPKSRHSSKITEKDENYLKQYRKSKLIQSKSINDVLKMNKNV